MTGSNIKGNVQGSARFNIRVLLPEYKLWCSSATAWMNPSSFSARTKRRIWYLGWLFCRSNMPSLNTQLFLIFHIFHAVEAHKIFLIMPPLVDDRDPLCCLKCTSAISGKTVDSPSHSKQNHQTWYVVKGFTGPKTKGPQRWWQRHLSRSSSSLSQMVSYCLRLFK